MTTTTLHSISVDLSILDIYTNDLYTFFVSDFFQLHKVLRFVYIVAPVSALYSFLWLHSIPLCTYTTLFIYSSTDEHLGCLYFLAIVNSAAANMQCVSQDYPEE